VVFLDFENIPKFVQADLGLMYSKNFDEFERDLIDTHFLPLISPQVRYNDDPETDTQACLSDDATVDMIVNEINDYFGKGNTDLIVIDTQAEAFDLENENDNGAKGAGLVIRAMRKIAKRTGGAVIMIHHTAKSGEEANQRRDYGRGASRLATAMRYVVRFDQSKDSGSRFIKGEITVENVKSKGPKFYDGEKVHFSHNAEHRWMEYGGTKSPAEFVPVEDTALEPQEREAWIAWRMETTGCSHDTAKRQWNRKTKPVSP
jgi:RecA-family ATPase